MAWIRRAARQASALAMSPPLEKPTALTCVTGSQRPMASTSASSAGTSSGFQKPLSCGVLG